MCASEAHPLDAHGTLLPAQGRTWKVVDVPARSDTWLIEPAIATYERDDGEQGVLTLFRSRVGVTLQAYSSDGGHTWGPADFAALPNPNSRVRPCSSGHACALNPCTTTLAHLGPRRLCRAAQPQQPGAPMQLQACLHAYSSDGGHTWGPADFAALPNPNSRVRPCSSGHACALNPCTTTLAHLGPRRLCRAAQHQQPGAPMQLQACLHALWWPSANA